MPAVKIVTPADASTSGDRSWEGRHRSRAASRYQRTEVPKVRVTKVEVVDPFEANS
jgi:hypothetical protein